VQVSQALTLEQAEVTAVDDCLDPRQIDVAVDGDGRS
jgi:hypothetical protein